MAGEAEYGVEALELVEKYEPDLLLTDIRMPFVSGIELARQVREVRPATQIAFLSGYVDFNTNGGSEVLTQRLRYGNLIEEPTEPQKAGYVFDGWVTLDDPSLAEEWDFNQDKVEGDMVLYALWSPAQITVKFDLDGGNVAGKESIDDLLVTFGEPYGTNLPIPSKAGYQFDGWIYSGNIINEDTVVTTSGEHVLTARWIQEKEP